MKTVLNVKTDKQVKEEAQALAKHIGIPLSTVINAFLKEFVTTGEVRFSREPQLRPEVSKRIAKHLAEAKRGVNISPAFKSADEVKEYLKI